MKTVWGWIVATALGTSAALAQEPTSSDVTRCYVAYYSLGQSVDMIAPLQGNNWENLAEVDLAARQEAVAQQLGFASAVYAQTTAENEAFNLMRNALISPRSSDAAIARVAHCDELFGFTPAIMPTTEEGQQILRQQKKALGFAADDIVACDRVYQAGRDTPDAKKSFVELLWQGAKDANFNRRLTAMSLQADVVAAYGNIPISEVNRPVDELWKGRLPAALAAQDTETQNQFWTEVVACDALFEIDDPIQPGPLLDPNPSHSNCAAYYTALRALYPQGSQGFNYFQERGLNAARFVRLVGTPQTDQEIMDAIATRARAEFDLFDIPTGNPNYLTILYTYTHVEACDRQYGLTITQVPDEVKQGLREQ